jgi:hypothetical protein
VSRRGTRVLSGLFALWGAAQLAFPEQLMHALAPGRPHPPPWLVRVLGVRMLVQHGLVVRAPEQRIVAASAAVDGLHAASMLLVAAGSAGRRRVPLISAGIAGAASLGSLGGMPRSRR